MAAIKIKIDTGARTSALHAFEPRVEEVSGSSRVHFLIHPEQRNSDVTIEAVAPLLGWRRVRSSNGKTQKRPVIRTLISLGTSQWPIEVTLANRDEMGFRMLLGRSAMRGHVLIDPKASFLTGKPTGKKR